MQPIRQGDVILLPVQKIAGQKLEHLTLAEGEVTGHAHRISEGRAELYERDGVLYLRVLSETATLSHQEHHALPIPKGHWMIRIQREYMPRRTHASSPSGKAGDSDLRQALITQGTKTKILSPEPIVHNPKSVQGSAGKASTIAPQPPVQKPGIAKANSSEGQEMQDLLAQLQNASEKELMASVWHGIPESKRLKMSVQRPQSPQPKSYRSSHPKPSSSQQKSAPGDFNQKPKSQPDLELKISPKTPPKSSSQAPQSLEQLNEWRYVTD